MKYGGNGPAWLLRFPAAEAWGCRPDQLDDVSARWRERYKAYLHTRAELQRIPT